MTGTGDAVVRTVLDTGGAGRDGLLRRLVQVPPGARFEGTAGGGGELWFVIAGTARLTPGAGPALPARRDAGLWLPPGMRFCVHADGPGALILDSVSLPATAAPAPDGSAGAGGTAGPGGKAGPGDTAGPGGTAGPGDTARTDVAGVRDRGGAALPRLSEVRDCPVEITGDRQFRVLFGPGNGCAAATQFVGEIPPGRAPEHSHPYDEVVLVLAGEGVLHAGPADQPLAPGSCVHLPPGQPHCLENTGRSTLRVLGVFHPGGSPAAKRAD